MRLALFLLALPLCAAELTLSTPLAVDQITHSSVRACWATTGAVNASKQLAFDTTANFTANHTLGLLTVGTTSQSWSSMCMALSGLTASTSYTVCPQITAGANSTVCTNTGNANSRAAFTTSALPSPHPALPAAPSTFSTTYPAIDSTLTVANDCSDRTSKLTTAYADTNHTVKVVMPSLATQTNVACNAALDLSGFTKSGTGTVVITSSAEASGPSAGVRTSTANKNISWMLCTSGSAPALFPTGSTRLVDLYLEPCDSAASSGQGDPRITQYLVRFDHGPNGVVFDRVNFDGRGYPYRLVNAAYGYGNNIAFVDSYFNHIEVWEPWVDTTSIAKSGNQIISSLAFLMGHGDTTNTIGTFTVTQSSGTGNAYLSVRAAGAVEYRYSNGSASCSSPCTAVLDATLTEPSDAISLMWNGATRQIAYTAGTFGAQNFVSLQPITNLTNSSGSVQEAEWDSYGVTSDSCVGTSPTAKVWMIQNNFLGVTGFGVFPQGSCASSGPGFVINTSDWTISSNAFQSNDSCLVPVGVSLASSPFVCSRRHHFETKNGYRFSVNHNTFSNGFIAIGGNGAYAVDMKQDYIGSGSTVVSAVTDMYVGYNTITNEPACFYIAGDTNNSVGTNYWKLIARVEIEQNICQANAYNRSQFYIGTAQDTITNGGITLWVEEETEDVIMQHNTFYQPTGSIASVVLLTDRWSEGYSILNNIFYIGSPLTSFRGVQSRALGDPGWTTASTPPFNTASGSDGTTALNNGILPNATRDVRGNLFIAGCALAANSQCVDATPAGSLVGDLSAQYPASNFWITGGTFGARQDAVGWINRASVPSGLYLSPSSMYHNAGTDGLDIGVTIFVPPPNSSFVISGQSSWSGKITIGP